MKSASEIGRLLSVVIKDCLCLLRDRAGLAVLFVMPLALLLVMTLVQDAVVSIGPNRGQSELLVVDCDGGAVAKDMIESIASNAYYRVQRNIAGKTPTPFQARQAVLDGEVHACLIIPSGFSDALWRHGRVVPGRDLVVSNVFPSLEIVLDPTIPGAMREGFLNVLSRLVLLQELRATFQAVDLNVPVGTCSPGTYGGINVRIEDCTFSDNHGGEVPTVTQQNVPAWTMFAMFFIVVPLATQMIRERNDGTLRRSLVAPVGYHALVTGKLIVYGLVCVLQFIFLSVAGAFVFPWFGLPALTMGRHPAVLIPVVGAAALAACGFGVLIGTVARSHVQASGFGAVVVIILAAVGGVMVPVYVMPCALRSISVVSPLAWGLNAFLDVFMRKGTVGDVMPEIGALALFSVLTFSSAILYRLWKGQ